MRNDVPELEERQVLIQGHNVTHHVVEVALTRLHGNNGRGARRRKRGAQTKLKCLVLVIWGFNCG